MLENRGSSMPVALNAHICAPAPLYAPVVKVCSAWLPQTGQSPHSVSQGPLGSLPGPQLCVKDKLRLWLTTEGRFLQSLICYSSRPATIVLSPTVVSGFFLLSRLSALFSIIWLSPCSFLVLHLFLLPSECFLALSEVLLSHFFLSCFLLMSVSSASPLPASQATKHKQSN